MCRTKAFIVFALIYCLLGCSGSSKLVGNWNVVLPNQAKGVMSFTSDGKLSLVADDKENHFSATVNGVYHENGDQLFMTFKSVDLTEVPPDAKGHEDEIKAALSKPLNLGEEKVTTTKWTNDKAFTTTSSDGNTSTFTKV